MYFAEAPLHLFVIKGRFVLGEMTGDFEIAAELFRRKTIFNFHMNSFHVIETNMALEQYFLLKIKFLFLKMLHQTEKIICLLNFIVLLLH